AEIEDVLGRGHEVGVEVAIGESLPGQVEAANELLIRQRRSHRRFPPGHGVPMRRPSDPDYVIVIYVVYKRCHMLLSMADDVFVFAGSKSCATPIMPLSFASCSRCRMRLCRSVDFCGGLWQGCDGPAARPEHQSFAP